MQRGSPERPPDAALTQDAASLAPDAPPHTP